MFDSVVPSLIAVYLVSPVFFYLFFKHLNRVFFLAFTGLYLVLLGFIGFGPCFTRLYSVLPRFT